jgi:hypothetical protein
MPEARPLSPECRLLFRVADPGVPAAELVQLCREVRDWRRVVLLADRELATAGLWRAIAATEGAVVPGEVAQYLRTQALMMTFRMQRLAERLQRTVHRLRDAGVPVILLKGAALGAMVDPTFSSRAMSDVDILVRGADATRAGAAILDAGWSQTSDPMLHTMLKDAHHEPPFFDPEVGGLRLELHTRMLPDQHDFAFDEDDLWRDAGDASPPFDGARLPSVEHLLLHASAHFAWSHAMQFGAWRTFRLINAVLGAEPLDWQRLSGFARTSKAATTCYWTLRLSARLSGTVVPDEVLRQLEPPTPAWIARGLERHFIAAIAPGEGPPCPSIRVSDLLWRIAMRPGWSGHRAPARREAEERWVRARESAPAESRSRRVRRHIASARDWWDFAARTLAARE